MGQKRVSGDGKGVTRQMTEELMLVMLAFFIIVVILLILSGGKKPTDVLIEWWKIIR